MKILTILGARPQFIKAGSVSREIAKKSDIQEVIVHTGQHYDANMSDIFFEEMHIPKPDYYLGVGGKSHGVMTGQMIERIEEVALKEKPDWVMVYGDTNSTLAGAIVASKLPIKLAHVEAGLRSFNMKMPEEVNRILVDRVSDLLLCPTDAAVTNLNNEGFERFGCEILKSGDVMRDTACFYKQYARQPNIEINDNFVLCTVHRAENTDDKFRLENIFLALEEIALERQVILPMHPRTKALLNKYSINVKNITITEPLGYLEMVWLLANCSVVITDSGGLQKEAFFFCKPCITLRDETEWVELVDNRFNVLVGAEYESILSACFSEKAVFSSDYNVDLYGELASHVIVQELGKTK